MLARLAELPLLVVLLGFSGAIAIVPALYALGADDLHHARNFLYSALILLVLTVMLGIATLTDFGFNAAIFGMVAHGLITGMLFFIAGSTKDRFHTLGDPFEHGIRGCAIDDICGVLSKQPISLTRPG